MKKLLILAVISVLIASVSFAYADVQVRGTTISGSSDASVVQITITDSDGQRIWQTQIEIDQTFEITMPRLEDGKYTLSMKHGVIGGEQEVIEFTYAGPAPVGNFELEIELPSETAEDFDSFATKNRINNFERLMNFIRDSDEIERRLEVIILENQENSRIPRQDLDSVTRFTPDGLETLEYGIASTTFRAYYDIVGDASRVLELMNDGMSLDTAIDFLGIIPTPEPISTPPKILQPKDITVRATDYRGAIVSYEVLAIDAEDEIVRPFCRPLSGSSFPIGETTVTCSASDSDGNSAREISFTIIVKPPPLFIPDWVKEVAAFWCDDKIDDDAYIEGIQYLINNGIISVSTVPSSYGSSSYEIPSWIKNNACWWSLGSITDKEFTSGLEYLISAGIIRV